MCAAVVGCLFGGVEGCIAPYAAMNFATYSLLRKTVYHEET
jgi:hypothetical protein